MAYHDLSTDSGSTPAERREEANRILDILSSTTLDFTSKELDFIASIEDTDKQVSVKQLFWLRDIKAKYVD